jgi:putative transposase
VLPPPPLGVPSGSRVGRAPGGTPGPGSENTSRTPKGFQRPIPVPSTHTSLQYHLVFGTKGRLPRISPVWRSPLHAYMGGTIRRIGGIAHAIGGVADHVHLLVGLRATHVISNVLRDLKRSSSVWVHEEVEAGDFAWQEGYGAFTVSPSNVPRVVRYIQQQEVHHRTRSFHDEYRALLEKHGIAFDERYLV